MPLEDRTALFRKLRGAGYLLAAFVVWLSLLNWPVPGADNLDASWQLVLGQARIDRLQFGSEILFSYGPWGYLTTVYCHPEMFWQRVIWEVIFKGAVTLLVLCFAFRLPGWRATLAFAAAALFLSYYGDASYSLLAAGLLVMATQGSKNWSTGGIGVILGFLALQKFTLFLLTAVGVAGVTCVLVARRKPTTAAIMATAWLVGVVGSWLSAQQHLADLPLFVVRMWEFSSAYHDAMFLEESSAVFWCGAVTCVVAVLAIGWEVRGKKNGEVAGWLCFGLAAGILFIVWKQSFVRADGHVLGLFIVTLMSSFALRSVTNGSVLAALSIVGIWLNEPRLVSHVHDYFKLHVSESVAALGSPLATYQDFLSRSQSEAERQSLPKLANIIGREKVDVFGHQQSWAILGKLNYRPRPIFQSYQTCSEELARINGDFYASARAPEFVLARVQTVDNRLATADDARVWAYLLRSYVLVAQEKSWTLLSRKKDLPPQTFSGYSERVAPVGESLPVPTTVGQYVWAKIDLRPSWLGRIRAFLRRPAEASLRIEYVNGTRDFRLNTRAMRGGFILPPALGDSDDFGAMMTGASLNRPLRISIQVSPENRKYFADYGRVGLGHDD